MRQRLAQCAAASGLAALAIATAGCSGNSSNDNTASTKSSPPSASPAASSTSPPAASSAQPAAAPPSGTAWDGSSFQGIWIALPRTWIALNLAKLNLSAAMKRFATTGLDNAALQADLASLKQRKGLFFADLASGITSSNHFATNANGFCSSSGGISPGSAAIPGMEAAMRAEYAKINAQVQSVTAAQVAGGQAFQARIVLTTTSGYKISELQVVILATSGRTCFVTFSTDRPGKFMPVFNRAAHTIHVS